MLTKAANLTIQIDMHCIDPSIFAFVEDWKAGIILNQTKSSGLVELRELEKHRVIHSGSFCLTSNEHFATKISTSN